MLSMTKFLVSVYGAVSKISKGKTMTYKQVAMAAGYPRAFRAVGNVLNKNKDFKNIPCHRVIPSKGVRGLARLDFSEKNVGGYVRGVKKKVELLQKEHGL